MEMNRRDMMQLAACGLAATGTSALAAIPQPKVRLGLVKFDLLGIEKLDEIQALMNGTPFGGVFDRLPYSKVYKPGSKVFLTDEFSYNMFQGMSVTISGYGMHFNIDYETADYGPLDYYGRWYCNHEVYCDGILVPACFAAYVSRDGKHQSITIQYDKDGQGTWILRSGVIQILRTDKFEQEEKVKFAEFNPKHVVFPAKTADEYVGCCEFSYLIPTKCAPFRGAREYPNNEAGTKKLIEMFQTGEFSYVKP